MAATETRPGRIHLDGLPAELNATAYFVDRNLQDGRGDKVAIECGDQRITYRQVLEQTNRLANALRDQLGVRREERVLLLLLDTPEFAYSFFGAMKIGAVPVPTNTLQKSPEYEYLLNDSRARVLIVSEPLVPLIEAIPRERLRYLHAIVVVGNARPGMRAFDDLVGQASPDLEP